MPTRAQSMCTPAGASFMIGEYGCCCMRGRDAEDDQRHAGGTIGLAARERAHAGDPHHGGGGVAHHAARTAGVGGGDDRRQVADVHLAAEHRAAPSRRRSSPRRCCRGSDESTKTITSSTKAPFQSSGRIRGSTVGHLALLEMLREQRETHSSRPSRLARITHSCPMCADESRHPGPALKPVKPSL